MKPFLKILLCALLLVSLREGAIKCIQGDGSDLTPRPCSGHDKDDDQCQQAKYIEPTGVVEGHWYGCGPCPGDTKEDNKCVECIGNEETACNTKIETYECTPYNVVNRQYVVGEPLSVCNVNSICNRPVDMSSTAEGATTGCGGCGDRVNCEETGPVPVVCNQGGETDMQAVTCPDDTDTSRICHQTTFIQYVGLAGPASYGCGPCQDETNCRECEGNARKPCNTPIVQDNNFQCFDYEFRDGKLRVKEELTVCQRLRDTPPKCNQPSSEATESYVVKNNGCGGCEDGDSQCSECGKDKCNGTDRGTLSVLTLMVAVFIFCASSC